MLIQSLRESAKVATELYQTYTDRKPRLVPTGLDAVDRVIGGMSPATLQVLGAGTGIGKSSSLLSMAQRSASLGFRTGILSLEDAPDMWGVRALGMLSGVDSRRIRAKDLAPEEIRRVRAAEERLESLDPFVRVAYPIGGQLETVVESISALADWGADSIRLDYLQKISKGTGDRRTEVAHTMRMAHAECAKRGIPLLLVSQVKRLERGRDGRYPKPTRWDLKESGDIENEARMIIMLWRDDDSKLVHGVLDKSTVGGEGTTFVMRRDASGTLVEVDADGAPSWEIEW